MEGGSGGHLPESPARIFTALSLKLISARFRSQIFSGLTARSTADLKEPSRPLGPPGPTSSNPTYWVPALHHVPQRPSHHTSCSEVPHGCGIWEQDGGFGNRSLCFGWRPRWPPVPWCDQHGFWDLNARFAWVEDSNRNPGLPKTLHFLP